MWESLGMTNRKRPYIIERIQAIGHMRRKGDGVSCLWQGLVPYIMNLILGNEM